MHPNVHSSNVTITKLWKDPRCLSTVVHIYNGILAIRQDDYTIFAPAWMELEEITLSEISQAEKDNFMVSLMCGT